MVYARPHEIEIERFSPGLDGIPVQLNRLLVVGPTARLELEREDTGEIIEAEIPAPRARALNLKVGETLAIFPRCSQVFVEPVAGRRGGGTSTPPGLAVAFDPPGAVAR